MEELPAEVEHSVESAGPMARPYREHAPMHKLLSKIPQRIHRGVRGYDLNLTCLAAHPRFLALGVNAGLVSRPTFPFQAKVLVNNVFLSIGLLV